MTKFFQILDFSKFKKPFLIHFPDFWDKNIFSGKCGCHAQLHMNF